MAKIKFSRRHALFQRWNNRPEFHGTEAVQAVDLPISFTGSKRDIDMLFPLQSGRKFSELMYSDGAFEMPYLSPILLHRKLEGLIVDIWDETGRGKPLHFVGVNAKDITVEFNAKFSILVTMKLQLRPDIDKELQRLARLQLLQQTREIYIEGQQGDIFGQEDPEDPEEQPGLLGEEENEDEDEDEDKVA